MARLAPPASKVEWPDMKTEVSRTSSQIGECDEALSALTENCDYPLPQKESSSDSAATVTGDKPAHHDDDEVAMPIPIATLVFQDGRTAPVYTPIAGHEHLFRAQSTPHPLTPFVNSAPQIDRPIQAAPTPVPGSSQPFTPKAQQNAGPRQQPSPCKQQKKKPATQRQGLLKSKSLKRTRSIAQGLVADPKAVAENDDVDEDKDAAHVNTEESHTFYIGDLPAFKNFLHCRLDELTMKPLRGIVTHWVRLLEPRRLGDWGKYHEMLPSEADTPPWWPETVIYKEPSHLRKTELSTLAVEIMLVHRKVDEMKRKGSWVTKLREVANFTIQTTSADHFSSSKGSNHSEEMKKRAQEQILPSIFDVAQSYEDHIMQYSLFEGSGNVDSGRGKHHTWKPIPRPVRQQPHPKRPRRAVRHNPVSVQDIVCEASGEETEPDDTMTKFAKVPREASQSASSSRPTTALSQSTAHIPHTPATSDESLPKTCKVDEPVSISSPCTPASSQGDCRMYRTASTPNSSFDQSLHGLHLEEDEDPKPLTRTMSIQGNMQPSFHGISYDQAMQYPSTPTGFQGQMYQHSEEYAEPAPSSFAQAGPTFVNPFSMFNAPPPAMNYGQYAAPLRSTQGFSYDQGMFASTPMGFPNTPMSMPMTPSDSNMTFDGLPSDYSVDPEHLHHF